MNKNIPLSFIPVQGLEKQIQGQENYYPGRVSFATDTGKIFLDTETNRITMGGSGSSLLLGEATSVQQIAGGIYIIPAMTLINSTSLPKINDIIINSDGRFFKVKSIDESELNIYCNLIAVSGTGGGPIGPGGEEKISITFHTTIGYRFIYGQSNFISITPKAVTDARVNILYEIIGENNQHYSYLFENLTSGQTYDKLIDIGGHLFKGLNDINIKIYSENDGEKTYQFTSRSSIEMSLSASEDFSSLSPVYNNFTFICNAHGTIDKELIIQVDGEEIEVVDIGTRTGAISTSIQAPNNLPPHKACILTAFLREKKEDGSGAISNLLEYEIGWIDPNNQTTPVIWMNKYPTEIINYEKMLIEYMVYDPTTKDVAGRLGETTVFLKLNNGAPIERTILPEEAISKGEWPNWNIVNYIEGNNTITIQRGNLASRTIEIYVKPDTRRMELQSPENLLLNLSAAGRSNDETSSTKTQWSFIDKTGSINNSLEYQKNTTFFNFNWYNNGWDGECLRISNGASIDIDFPGSFVYNQSSSTSKTKSATFEVRFKVKNVKNYSTLITNSTYYYINGEPVLDSEVPEDAVVDTMKDPLTGEDTGFPMIKIEKVINTQKGVFCSFYDEATKAGFALGTQEAYFSTGGETVSVRYTEDEIITISMVVEHFEESSGKASLLSIYLNGVLSGVVKMSKEFQIKANKISFNSEYCDVDLYNVRAYNTRLDMGQIVQNYLYDCRDIQLYDENTLIYANIITEVERNGKITSINEPTISYKELVNYNANVTDSEKLSMCYMIITVIDNDGKSYNSKDNLISIDDDRLPYYKGDKRKCTVKFINPSLDAAFAKGEIGDEYIYHLPSFETEYMELNVQGTSSQGYPRRNYKAKLKTKKDASGNKIALAKYLDGPKKGETFTKLHLDNEHCSTDTFTWKVDYMESSSCHNTGLANLMDTMYEGKHPMDYYEGFPDSKDKNYRTTVYGVPVLVFHQHSREGQPIPDSYQFIGKYNFNLDKGSNEYYGYEDSAKTPYVLDEEGNLKKISDVAESWEFKNNQGIWTSFKLPDGVSDFNTPPEPGKLQEFIDHFEYRYSNEEDKLDEAYEYLTEKKGFNSVAEVNEFLIKKYENFRKMFMWVNSTDVSEASDEKELLTPVIYNVEEKYMTLILETIYKDGKPSIYKDEYDETLTYYTYNTESSQMEPYIFTSENKEEEFNNNKENFYIKYDEKLNSRNPTVVKLIRKEFKYDTVEYRLTKFKQEFEKHFNLDYCLVYFIMTELLIMFDSRGKNMFLSSWGPQEEGGDYIWFPVFYDMDTQLGVNNTGIPSYEYDLDATQTNAFSTGNSVLWKNFYTCFENEIKNKYRQLRGSGDDGIISKKKIEDSYNYSPDTYSESYAMKGVRPLITHNVDEYYKYLAPMYSGYRNTAGDLKFDTGSFLYACQGTRQLYRSALLTNRLNYIDSWWGAGKYRTDTTSSTSLWMRVNYNDYEKTSDRTVVRALLPSEEGTLLSQDTNWPNKFDSQPVFNITPYLKQYVSVGYDAIYTDPVKAEGNIAKPQPSKAIEDSFKNVVGTPDQLVYIPGAEYIENFGDLSLKYLSEFHFDAAIRTKQLQLGNDNIGYENRSLTGDRLELANGEGNGNEKRLLESIVLTNLTNLDKTIDVSGSAKLKEFRALNTSIPKVIFAEGVALDTLHLSKNLTDLELIDAWGLNQVISEQPISLGEQKYLNSKGLYLENITDKNLDEISSLKLRTIKIEGGSLGPESYLITQKAMRSKTEPEDSLAIYLKDVKWSPYYKVENDANYNSSLTYYTLTDHYTFEAMSKAVAQNNYKNGYLFNSNYNNSIITSIDLLEDCVNNDKFTSTELVSGAVLNPHISGEIYINNPSDKKINDWDIKRLMVNNYPQLKIYAANVNKGLLVKFIQDIDNTEITFQTDLYNPFPESDKIVIIKPKDIPYKEHYDFKYWTLSLENGVKADYFNGKEYREIEKGTSSDIMLYAYFEKHLYDVTFEYEDGQDTPVYKVKKYAYGDRILDPGLVPYKKDDLSDAERYSFKGFIEAKNAGSENPDIIDFNTLTCKGTSHYKSFFKKESVYDSVSNLDWFEFSPVNNPKGYSISINPKYIINAEECLIRGKITLPSYYKGEPVVGIRHAGTDENPDPNGFKNNTNITHIYWKEQENEPLSLQYIGEYAFQNSQLKSFQFTSRLENVNNTIDSIGQRAFNGCLLSSQSFRIKNYVTACFSNGLFSQNNPYVIKLSDDIEILGSLAFYADNQTWNSVDLGTSQKGISKTPYQLLEDDTVALLDNYFPKKVSKITIYCQTLEIENEWTQWLKNTYQDLTKIQTVLVTL